VPSRRVAGLVCASSLILRVGERHVLAPDASVINFGTEVWRYRGSQRAGVGGTDDFDTLGRCALRLACRLRRVVICVLVCDCAFGIFPSSPGINISLVNILAVGVPPGDTSDIGPVDHQL
jgi:hypothetical protein